MRIYIIIIKLFLVLQIGLTQVNYSGIVQAENGEPLIFANILSFEELKGWQTNFDGEYEFTAAKDLEIFVVYTGFERLKANLKLRDTLTVKEVKDDGGIFMPYPNYIKHYSGIRFPQYNTREEFRKRKIDSHKVNSIGTLIKGEQYHSYENPLNILENSQIRVNYNVKFNIVELKPDSLNFDEFLVLNEVENGKILIFGDVIPIDALKEGIYELYSLNREECLVNSDNVVEINTNKSMLGVIIKRR